MKNKIRALAWIFSVVIVFCFSPVTTFGAEQKVAFTDENLEKAIRDVINKPTGDIYTSDTVKVTTLELYNKKISNIEGLQYFTALTNLNLAGNNLSDIKKLSGLTNLKELFLCSNFKIKDITPLSKLLNLTTLSLFENNVSDITPLKNLKKLTLLFLDKNPLKDYSPLKDIYPNLKDKDFKMEGSSVSTGGSEKTSSTNSNSDSNSNTGTTTPISTTNTATAAATPPAGDPYKGKWTIVKSGVTEKLNSVAFGSNLYVAVGDNGCIIKSKDCVSWTSVSTPFKTINLKKVIWNGNMFVAVGDKSSIVYSKDGNEWVDVTIKSVTTDLTDIVWDGKQFLIVGDNVLIKCDKPGDYKLTIVKKAFLRDIEFNGEIYVAFGYGTRNELVTTKHLETRFETREQGKNYQVTYEVTTTSPATFYNSFLYLSFDGESWKQVQVGNRINCATTSGSEMIAICDYGYFRIYKDNAGDYQLKFLDSGEFFNSGFGGVAWDGEKYLVTLDARVDTLYPNVTNRTGGSFSGLSPYRKLGVDYSTGVLNGIAVLGNKIIAAGREGTLFIADRDNSKPEFSIKAKSGTATAAVLHVNGKVVALSEPLVKKESDYLVQAEVLCKSLKLAYKYDSKSKVVTISKGKTVISMKLNEKIMTVGKAKIQIKTAANFNKVPYVPVKAVVEALGFKYSYDEKTKILSIT